MIKIQLKKNIKISSPWIYKKDILWNSSLDFLEQGIVVEIYSFENKFLAIGYFNAISNITIRVLSFSKTQIDQAFFTEKILTALDKRNYPNPYYRLINAEGDGLPGLIIDRFDKILVCQISSFGMENLKNFITLALNNIFPNNIIFYKNTVNSRIKEGLKNYTEILNGKIPDLIEVVENNFSYLANLTDGQKTGWFYDQKAHRSRIANLAKGKKFLDCYCYSGGFGLLAKYKGASDVWLVDSSNSALEIAKKSAEKNNLNNISFVNEKAEIFLKNCSEKFDVISLDPPPLIKSKKDKIPAMKFYEEILQNALRILNPDGILFFATCSFHADPNSIKKIISKTLDNSKRTWKFLDISGADLDHPTHANLHETRYLNGYTMHIS